MRDSYRHQATCTHEPTSQQDYWCRRATEQSHRRPECFRSRVRDHQDGMLKERRTYEIMLPEDVGFVKTDLVLGKHSGRAALADRARSLVSYSPANN